MSSKEAHPNAFKERGFPGTDISYWKIKQKIIKYNYIKNIVETIHVEAIEGKSQFWVSKGES